MNLILVAGLLAGAAQAPLPLEQSHSVRLDHRGTPVEAVYQASVDVRHRQVGMAPPTRMGSVRCTWTATVSVERRLAGATAAALRPISAEQALSGSRHGDCATSKRAIEREVAARSDEVREHLVAVAERDRHQLLAELDAARNLASN